MARRGLDTTKENEKQFRNTAPSQGVSWLESISILSQSASQGMMTESHPSVSGRKESSEKLCGFWDEDMFDSKQ